VDNLFTVVSLESVLLVKSGDKAIPFENVLFRFPINQDQIWSDVPNMNTYALCKAGDSWEITPALGK